MSLNDDLYAVYKIAKYLKSYADAEIIGANLS